LDAYINLPDDEQHMVDPKYFRLPDIPDRKPDFSLYKAETGERPSTKGLANDRKSVCVRSIFKKPVKEEQVIEFQEVSDQCRDLTRKLDMFTNV
jgi:hypothetical protein